MTIAEQIARKSSRNELLDSIRALPHAAGMAPDEWVEMVSSLHPVFRSDLAWLTPSERRWVFGMAKDHIKNSLLEFYPGESIEKTLLERALGPLVTWFEILPDHTVVRFCWDVIAWRPKVDPSHAWYLIRRLQESGRLTGAISRENIEIAVTLVREADEISSRPKGRWRFIKWDRDSQTYFESLEDPSYLVRAASANALGALLSGCLSEGGGCGAPAITDMLALIQKQEQKRAGVAGPFLDGAGLAGIPADEWLRTCRGPAGFDLRAWFLDTLRTSSREPSVPHLIPLEFLAHELFCCDAAAIEVMIEMGREYAALLAATEDPQCIDRLLPLLAKMSNSPNTRVAGAIRIYLKERRSHSGMNVFQNDDG